MGRAARLQRHYDARRILLARRRVTCCFRSGCDVHDLDAFSSLCTLRVNASFGYAAVLGKRLFNARVAIAWAVASRAGTASIWSPSASAGSVRTRVWLCCACLASCACVAAWACSVQVIAVKPHALEVARRGLWLGVYLQRGGRPVLARTYACVTGGVVGLGASARAGVATSRCARLGLRATVITNQEAMCPESKLLVRSTRAIRIVIVIGCHFLHRVRGGTRSQRRGVG